MEGFEGVDHNGVFFGALLADAFFDGSGMRAVRYAAGVMGDAGVLQTLPAHEFALNVIEHLVGVDVGVVVGCRDGQGMVVVFARAEGADHVVVRFEGLVNGRRLVHPSGDRLEILHVENPGVEVAVPADHIEGMEFEEIVMETALLFDTDFKLALFVEKERRFGPADVAFAERAVLEKLAQIRAVPFRDLDGAGRIDDEHPVLVGVERHLPGDPAGDADIIERFEGELAEIGLQHALAFVDEQHLVVLAVAVEIVHLFGGPAEGDLYIVVVEHHNPAAHRVAALRHVVREQVVMTQKVFLPGLDHDLFSLLNPFNGGWRIVMVEQ